MHYLLMELCLRKYKEICVLDQNQINETDRLLSLTQKQPPEAQYPNEWPRKCPQPEWQRCIKCSRSSRNCKDKYLNNTCDWTGTHVYLINVKKNFFFTKRLTIFFSILKVDETKSSRGGATINHYGQSYGNNASSFKIINGTLMHCTIQLHKMGSNYGSKNLETFLALIFVSLWFSSRKFL